MSKESLLELSIPDRSPGYAFIVIAHPGCRRHTKGRKAEVVFWYKELARWILLRPTPTPAGDKPPRYIPLTHTPQFGPFVRYLQHTNDEVRWWPAGGGLPHPAQGAHKGHPYGRLGKWWDASGQYRPG